MAVQEYHFPRFVVDTMLGKLARWLRALGYDTVYVGRADDAELLELVRREGRRLLTRDVRLARVGGGEAYLVEADRLDAQLEEVIHRLGLAPRAGAFLSRCLDCNGLIEPRAKPEVRALVSDYTYLTQERFFSCRSCGKVYWQGSHYDRILEKLRPFFPGC